MNVYEARHAGREYCNDTEGSEHYKQGDIEPLDIFISKGLAEDFCICNMVKYAIRFKKTRNLADLRKVSDYAQILCGVELDKTKEPYTTYLEEMGEEDVSEPFDSERNVCGVTSVALGEPVKGKYEGLSDEELHDLLCARFDDCDTNGNCPLWHGESNSLENCYKFVREHPEEFRKIAIDWLDKQDGLEGKA